MSEQYTSVECEEAHGALKAMLAGERDDGAAITLTRGTLGAIARVIEMEIEFRAGFVRRASAAEAQLAAERARAGAAEGREARLRGALEIAERNTTDELIGHGSNLLRMCRVCDQVGEREHIPHAPDCPFAALAGTPEGEPANRLVLDTTNAQMVTFPNTAAAAPFGPIIRTPEGEP